jgi:hypothetical protein
MKATTDPRYAELRAAVSDFIKKHGLHPDPDTYLAHGYVDLCLRGWPTAAGAPLRLAAEWAIWTWLADDVFDQELRDASLKDINEFVLALLDTATEADQPSTVDHPIVQALADLVRQTRQVMPAYWWRRYHEQLAAWIHAASSKLTLFLRTGHTPTLREYMGVRPADGGMLLAAMWTELAEQCITPDWRNPAVQGMLSAFSTCGCLANDLAATGSQDTFTAVYALVNSEAMTVLEARQHVATLLRAEEKRFWWLYTSVRRDFDEDPQPPAIGELVMSTSRFALIIDRFRCALAEWTAGSSRYAPPTQPQAV